MTRHNSLFVDQLRHANLKENPHSDNIPLGYLFKVLEEKTLWKWLSWDKFSNVNGNSQTSDLYESSQDEFRKLYSCLLLP